MKTSVSGLVLVVIGLLGASASAQIGGPSNDIFKARTLYSACNPATGEDKATRDSLNLICEFYLRGLTDGLHLMHLFTVTNSGGCLPEEAPISTDEAKTDLTMFLRDNPEAAQNSAAIVAGMAIMRAHPCPKSN